jgi:hypothetical protein
MAEAASSFVRDWIRENVVNDSAFDGDVDARLGDTVARLIAAAKEADIEQDDPEMAPDLLRDLIGAAIKEAQGSAA